MAYGLHVPLSVHVSGHVDTLKYMYIHMYIVYRLGLMYLLYMYPTELHTCTCIHVPRKVYQTTQSEDGPYNQATSIYNVIHTKALGVSGTGRFHVINHRCTKSIGL